jgi:hypothetical protein
MMKPRIKDFLSDKTHSSKKVYPHIKPGKKRFKSLVIKLFLMILGRALQSGSIHDPEIRRETAGWPDNFLVMMNVIPEGPRMVLEKIHTGLKYRGNRTCRADLVISFKNIECAFMVLTPQIGPAQAFAQRRMTVTGDLANAMIFTRCLNSIIAYLYPKFISRRLLKRVPVMTPEKQFIRIIIYAAGIPFGL